MNRLKREVVAVVRSKLASPRTWFSEKREMSLRSLLNLSDVFSRLRLPRPRKCDTSRLGPHDPFSPTALDPPQIISICFLDSAVLSSHLPIIFSPSLSITSYRLLISLRTNSSNVIPF